MGHRWGTAALVAVVGLGTALVPVAPAAAIGAVTVRITPTAVSVPVGGGVQLSAAVANAGDVSVSWSLRSAPGTGTVSSSGLFTAPASLPPGRTALVRATSVFDPSVHSELVVRIAGGTEASGVGAVELLPRVLASAWSVADQVAADIDGDGTDDLIRLEYGFRDLKNYRLSTVTDVGGARTVATTAWTAMPEIGPGYPDYALEVAAGDLDADGDVDAVVGIDGNADVSGFRQPRVFLNDGSGVLVPQAQDTSFTGRGGARVAVVDWDLDGVLDLVSLNRQLDSVSWSKGLGDGTFSDPVTLVGEATFDAFAVGDLSGDGRPDLAAGGSSVPYVLADHVAVVVNDGFGGVATTYELATRPDPSALVIADADADGWNDLVVAEGTVGGVPSQAARIVAYLNTGDSTGAVGPAPVSLLDGVRVYALESAHLDADARPDLVALDADGLVQLLQATPGSYTVRRSTVSQPLSTLATGEVTGDGRVDTLAAGSLGDSLLVRGSVDVAPSLELLPTVTRANATTTTRLQAVLRNSPSTGPILWSATNGTVAPEAFATTQYGYYQAPSSAAVDGTPASVTVSQSGLGSQDSLDLTVVNESFELTSLGSRQVRAVATDPADPSRVYAATDQGVLRSVNGGVSFAALGTTTLTGSDARSVAVVRDAGSGVDVVLAATASGVFRFDLAAPTDWVDADGGVLGTTGVTLSPAPSSPRVLATSGGGLYASTDAGLTWTSIDPGTAWTRVVALSATAFVAAREATPSLVTGTVGDPALGASIVPRSTGDTELDAAPVTALVARPGATDEVVAAVTPVPDGRGVLRSSDGGATWTAGVAPFVVTALSAAASPSQELLVAGSDPGELRASVDAGATWYSVARGFSAGASFRAVAHRSDGVRIATAGTGLYTPVTPSAPDAPVLDASGPSGTTGPDGPFVLTWTGGAGLTFRCGLDGDLVACTSPTTFPGPLGEGSHTFAVRAVDAQGNESSAAVRTWSVDATPPGPATIVSGPSGTVSSTSATIAFELPAGAVDARCSLDGATATTCATSVSYSGLADGSHTVSVRARDAYGNLATAATRTWTVDTTPPPTPDLAYYGGAVTAETTATFFWTPAPGVTYVCTLDGTTVPCGEGTYTASGLADGSHSFFLEARDEVGNASSASAWWTVAGAASVSFASTPSSVSGRAASFSFSPGPSTVALVCSLDVPGPGPDLFPDCQNGLSLSSLAAGEHALTVTPYNVAFTPGTPITYTWMVDAAGPTVTSYAGPTALTVTGTSLAGAAVVRFSEPVVGVSAATVRLQTSPSGAAVSTALQCRDGADRVVACSHQGVRSVVLRPAAPLVPGQLYAVRVQGLTDAVGNAGATTVTGATRAPTVVQDSSVAVGARWRTVALSAARGGSYTTAALAGATSTGRFSGSSLTLYGWCGPTSGKARVSVDGEAARTVDLYAASARRCTLASWTGLGAGSHSFELRALGTKRTVSKGTAVSLDAYAAGGVLTATPSVVQRWSSVASSKAGDGRYVVDQLAGASVRVTFRGRGIDWVMIAGPRMGKARVTIDGRSVATVDTYATSTKQVLRRFSGLADGVHTLVITVTGTRRSASGGTAVALDRFVVLP